MLRQRPVSISVTILLCSSTPALFRRSNPQRCPEEHRRVRPNKKYLGPPVSLGLYESYVFQVPYNEYESLSDRLYASLRLKAKGMFWQNAPPKHAFCLET